jgi:double-strand break repair protein MRE11
LQSAIDVLRNHCLGDRDIAIDIVSEQGAALHGKSVNFEDPNFNVQVGGHAAGVQPRAGRAMPCLTCAVLSCRAQLQLPCFAIHGDHDDPGGEGGLSALDILSSANLLNYFGKAENTSKIVLQPLLIRKGASTRVALYGLGCTRHRPRALSRTAYASRTRAHTRRATPG